MLKPYKNTPDACIISSVAFIFGGILFAILVAGYDIKHHTFNIRLGLLDAAYFVVAYLLSCMEKT